MVQGEACIEECQKILQMTLSGKIDEIYKHSLTDTESIVFNILALSYYLLSDKERSIYIYKKLLESYERSKVTSVFYIRRWGLMMSNLIMCLEETGEFDEAIKNFNSKIKLEMEIGKINGIVHSLVTMASITEQKKDKENGKIRFTQVLDMLHLMKRKLDYKTVKAHMKNPEFFLNE